MNVYILNTGLLDQNWNSIKTIQEMVDLCIKAEALNFKGFFIAEHQSPGYACHTPEILLTILGMSTSRIRLGVAGLQYNLNLPVKVAQQYKLLNALFDGRIDLGLGKANVNDEIAIHFTNTKGNDPYKSFENQVLRLKHIFFGKHNDVDGETGALLIEPHAAKEPKVFLLGNSQENFRLCIESGFDIAVSFFHKASASLSSEMILNSRDKFYQKHNRKLRIFFAICFYLDEDGNTEKRKVFLENPTLRIIIFRDALELRDHILAIQHEFDFTDVILLDIESDHRKKMANLTSLSEVFNL